MSTMIGRLVTGITGTDKNSIAGTIGNTTSGIFDSIFKGAENLYDHSLAERAVDGVYDFGKGIFKGESQAQSQQQKTLSDLNNMKSNLQSIIDNPQASEADKKTAKARLTEIESQIAQTKEDQTSTADKPAQDKPQEQTQTQAQPEGKSTGLFPMVGRAISGIAGFIFGS